MAGSGDIIGAAGGVATLAMEPEQLQAELRRWFGFDAFLPGQGEVIARVLRGEDLLVVRPTGSGKSLCYQLPALLLPPLTVVISPLISLMKDQVDALNERHDGQATFINSSLPIEEQRRRLQQAVSGEVKLLYVAPERFRYNGFLRRLQETRVQRFVVDEAHCVSEWGHDFRPDYLALREILPKLGNPPLLALTATATVDVQGDLAKQLGRAGLPPVVSGFNRPNLSFEVRYAVDQAMKWRHLEQLLSELEGSGIIYAGTRKETEEVAEFARGHTARPVTAYHAGFEAAHRSQTQEAFMASRDAVAVATNAFGMGIDKPDVRFVIHYSLPGTVEAYYQQAGRAGRDGQPARCILLYDPADRSLQEWFIEQEMMLSPTLNALLAAVDDDAFDYSQLAARAGCNDIQARVAFGQLEQLGYAVDRGIQEPGRFNVVKQPLARPDADAHDARCRGRRALREAQLGAMVRYAETAGARRTFLLGYFGDRTQPDAAELARDDPPPPAPDPAQVTPEETDLGRAILATVAGARHGVGRQKLVQVLKGSKSQGLSEALRRLPTYGVLARWNSEQLLASVDHLVYTGLLKPIGGDRPVLAMTAAGQRVVDDPRALVDVAPLRTMAPVLASRLPGKQSELMGLSAKNLAGSEAELFERLRLWRREQARQHGLAPYLICSDRSLLAVARARPAETSTLLQIPGLGPHKVERYGADLLAEVERWQIAVDRGELAPPPSQEPVPTVALSGPPAAASVPTDDLDGPWERCWQVTETADLDRLAAELATVPGLTLAAPVGRHEPTWELLQRLSRRCGLPISFGLFDDDGRLRCPERLGEAVLLAGPSQRLARAAEQAGARARVVVLVLR